MSSIFTNEPGSTEELTPEELIEQEIEGGKPQPTSPLMDMLRYGAVLFVFFLIGIYVIDPFYFASHKKTAIDSYLYLREFGDKELAQQLHDSAYFTASDRRVLERRRGLYNDRYPNVSTAREAASEALAWLADAQRLREGDFSKAGAIDWLRGVLFVNVGLTPPLQWVSMNPVVSAESKSSETPQERQSWRDQLRERAKGG